MALKKGNSYFCLYDMTRCQLKWRMLGQNHQFWKCFFHILSFQCLNMNMKIWNLKFFYKICVVARMKGPKSPTNGPFWTANRWRMAFFGQKLFVFVSQHVGPCLRCTQLFAVHLFCKIAQVLVDLLAFYPELPFLAQKRHFWAINIFFLLDDAPILVEYPVYWDSIII